METVVAPGKRVYMPTVNHLGFTQRISIGMKIGTVELIEIVNPTKGNGILVVSEKFNNDPVVSSVIVNITKQKHLGCKKKCEAKKNQRLKALISVRAKKFIPSHLFATNFYFKGTQQFTGCFPNQDWLCHPWPPFLPDPL